jgi:hypothetical protein
MKKLLLLSVLFSQWFSLLAQHCPWDCSGMILLESDVPESVIAKLQLALVDENKNELNDTVYGTGKDLHDPCIFLPYKDFMAYRVDRIAVDRSYQHDTVYRFAEDLLMVKFNYCNYRDRKLYLRFINRHASPGSYYYVEIPDSLRIHLHEYSTELYAGKKEEIKKKVQPFIVRLDCDAFFLKQEECR